MPHNRDNLLILQQGLLITLSWWIAVIIAEFWKLVPAYQHGIDWSWTPEGIVLSAAQEAWVACDCVVSVYAIGSILALLLGIILFQTSRFGKGSWLYTLQLWTALFLMTRLTGSWLADIVVQEGLWYVASWSYLNIVLQYITGVALLIGVLVVGLAAQYRLLYNLDVLESEVDAGRSSLIAAGYILLPYLLAGAIILVWRGLSQTDLLHQGIVVLSGAIMLLPVLTGKTNMAVYSYHFPRKIKRPYRARWQVIAVAAALLLIIRVSQWM